MPPCRTTLEMRWRLDAGFARHDGERLLGGLALLGVEIGGHIFGQHHRRHRQHVEKAHRAVPGLRQRRRRRDRGLRQLGVGEIDRHENGFEHLRLRVRDQPLDFCLRVFFTRTDIRPGSSSRAMKTPGTVAPATADSVAEACFSSFGLTNSTSLSAAERHVGPVVDRQSRRSARPEVGRLSASALRAGAIAAAGQRQRQFMHAGIVSDQHQPLADRLTTRRG